MIPSISFLLLLTLRFVATFPVSHDVLDLTTTQKQSYTLHLTRVPSTGKTSSRSLLEGIASNSDADIGNITSTYLGQEIKTLRNHDSLNLIPASPHPPLRSYFPSISRCPGPHNHPKTILHPPPHPSPKHRQNQLSIPFGRHRKQQRCRHREHNIHLPRPRISFAGIEVKKQKVGLAYLAGWFGDSVSSGLLGLAFPSITSVYDGSDPKKDVASTTRHPNATSNQRPYSSLMNTMFFEQNLTDPIFSLALSRDGAGKTGSGYGGLIEIGGVPDLKQAGVNASTDFVGTAIQILERQWINPLKPAYQFYTIGVDSFVYKNSKSAKIQYIVDSGTTLNYVPSAEAAAINALFVPPAQNVNGNYMVQCNAEAPQVGIKVNGTTIALNPADMILKANERGTQCQSGIADGGSGPFMLGDVFLVNVLAVFDLGNMQMKFSQRQYYV
ncbi:uncharacterized protein PAC_05205 [Phialocephala subalpina]|uniref:Peptidase A1 domain-containing protein n=1 Tax=Phialocephala subalpina TaxID=576137 RepID=A0A1L7WRC2_9HELO|nr:uncharacterized protein PAC_05205 [Phialocephala subalpina]